jgi:hypothetical protein
VKHTRNGVMYVLPELPICDFYTLCKAIGERCVVTIGRDLIARGISYVGRDSKQPLTATTMIYKPGTSMHAVGIVQAVGRITGTAMPCLKRRLYAPGDVITTYKAFNANQETYISEIENSTEQVEIKNIIDRLEFCKIKRKIDRASLRLKMNMTHEYASDSESESESDDGSESESDDNPLPMGTRIIVDRLWTAGTMLGQAFRYIYGNPDGVSKNDFLEYLSSVGSQNPTSFWCKLCLQENQHIFYGTSNTIDLQADVRNYVDSSLLDNA